MPLYTVRTTIEVVVEAESAEHACEVAAGDHDEICYQSDLNESSAWQSEPFVGLPEGWDEDCLPFGEASRSIKEILEAESDRGD